VPQRFVPDWLQPVTDITFLLNTFSYDKYRTQSKEVYGSTIENIAVSMRARFNCDRGDRVSCNPHVIAVVPVSEGSGEPLPLT